MFSALLSLFGPSTASKPAPKETRAETPHVAIDIDATPKAEMPQKEVNIDVYGDLFKTLETSEARKLLIFIFDKDFDAIMQLKLIPATLGERDANGVDILTHINRTGNQELRDIVFANIDRNYTTAVEVRFNILRSGNPSQLRFLSDAKYYLAAALNQLEVLKAYRPCLESNPKLTDEELLHVSKQYGHEKVTAYLMGEGYGICSGDTPPPAYRPK